MSTNINVNRGGGATSPRDYSGRTTIAGLFRDRDDAERAISELKDAGFTGDQIGIAMRDQAAQGEMTEKTGTKSAEGAVTGAVGGGTLGGVLGFLVGAGALAIPGVGPVVAGGMLASALGLAGGTAVAGAGIGAATGGIAGALVGLGIPDEEAQHFETGFREGGVLVTVKAAGRAMDALAVLERNGADTGPGSVGATSRGGTTSAEGRRGPGAGTAGGALGGAAAGAAAGTAVAGPVGTVVGGAAGAMGGAAAGADARDEEWTTDASGNRVRRTGLDRR
jgi:hypothetical protein